MDIIHDAMAMRTWSRKQRKAGRSIGLVPTMGALHEGHLSLMRASMADNDVTVASIFVNPAQFAPHEDLDAYPRTLDEDCRKAEAEGVDIIYAPQASRTYPANYATYIEVHGLQDHLCGASRPTFFRGIATVVAKLFNVVDPDRAYFGQKDAQQAAIIRRMVRDLDFAIAIEVLPIIRESDGLAISSRNQYLSAEERDRSVSVSRAIEEGRRLLEEGERDGEVIKSKVRATLNGVGDVDYVEMVDAEEIQPLDRAEGNVLLAVAAQVGKARLIDNVTYEVPKP
jgi:pantoate--beta-alanine ligase